MGFALPFALALHVGCAIGFLRALPLYNWPDEPAHLNYVRRLAGGGGFAAVTPESWHPAEIEELKRRHFRSADETAGTATMDYEAHQPPLYYVIAALIYRLTASAAAVKCLNLLLSCLALILAWKVARRIDPRDGRLAAAAILFLALVPTRCFIAVSVGNDVLAELCFTAFTLAVVSGARPSLIGATMGAGLLTKASLLVSLPLYAAWLLLVGGGDDRSSPSRDFMTAAVVTTAVAAPWFAHNVAVYDWWDPTGIWSGALARAASGTIVPRLTWTGPFGASRFCITLFLSWWGVFGWMEMFPGVEVVALYVVLAIVPAVGAARRLVAEGLGPVSLWLALAPFATAAALVLYSLSDFQPQGRYLMVVSVAIAILWAGSARALFGRWFPAWIALTTLALTWANFHCFAHIIPWYLAR